MTLYNSSNQLLARLALKDNIHVLLSKEFGEDTRDLLGLDDLDKTQDYYFIEIPNNIYCITANFFIGLFYNSIKYLGKAGFKDKYKFIYSNDTIGLNIEDGIKDCLLFMEVDIMNGNDIADDLKTDTNINYMQIGAMQRLAMSNL